MLARMYERRLKGYSAIGYSIEQQTADVLPLAAATDAAGYGQVSK